MKGIAALAGLILISGMTQGALAQVTRPVDDVAVLRAKLLAGPRDNGALSATDYTPLANVIGRLKEDGSGRAVAALRDLLAEPGHLNGDVEQQAVNALSEIRSKEAMAALSELLAKGRSDQRYLDQPNVRRRFRRTILVALGNSGTVEAIDAIAAYEKAAEARRAKPAPFRFGPHEHPIEHFAESNLKLLVSAQDDRQRNRAIFMWKRYPESWLWLTQQTGQDQWADPVVVPLTPKPAAADTKPADQLAIKGDHVTLAVAGTAGTFLLSDLQRDSDKDGLTDHAERMLGTRPDQADSDADGIPDLVDPAPLTPSAKATEAMEIRQAIFLVQYGVSESKGCLIMVRPTRAKLHNIQSHLEGKPLQAQTEQTTQRDAPIDIEADFTVQEYYGFPGYQLPAREIREGCNNITAIAFKLTSPTTAIGYIEDWEGNMAASGLRMELKKIHGRWVVTKLLTSWIS